MVPFPDMGAALKAGRVNAISAVEPFMTGAGNKPWARSR